MDFQNSKRRGLSFRAFPYRISPARGRGQTWRNTLRPDIGNHIEQPGSVAEARDRPFVALFRIYRVPDPFIAVALRVSDCLLHSRRSPLRLSFLSEVGFLKHCPRSSAVCVVIGLPLAEQEPFAVRALFQWWSASWWNALQFMVSQSPRKGLTQYDTADIALAIIVSPDTPGAPALAFGRLHHRSGRALSVVVNHSTRVSFSVFSSRNFRTYCLFLIWVDCFEGIKLIKVDWVTIIPYRG